MISIPNRTMSIRDHDSDGVEGEPFGITTFDSSNYDRLQVLLYIRQIDEAVAECIGTMVEVELEG